MAGNTVTINVTKTGYTETIQDLNLLKQKVEELNKSKVQIKIESGSLETLNKESAKTINAMARIENAQASLQRAENQRINSETKLQIAVEKTRQEELKLDQAAERTQQEEAKVQQQTERTTQAFLKNEGQLQKTAQGLKKTGEGFKEAGEQAKFFELSAVQSIDNFWKKLENRAIHMFFNEIKKSFKEALDMMHAVDDELVTVRKVSGWDPDTMQGVEQNAYEIAKTYGVAANDYLANVSEFVRAGYRENAEALAELAIKTQIVGDTTAEVANQFLLSTDKAYQYEGSIEKLTAVLDGANEIDNNFATSIEKIASGMGIVAPVAAQMNVGVDELAASIGTITAVTQRSGTEAARALRAIFLNIVGDTKTEIDEGVTWTTGEIEGLRDVIKKYAPEAYAAAEATGSIIDPMEAIAGLSQSVKDGLLTEQELMEMVSDIGGKLRSSQLLALIENWDMYSDMLERFGDAAGSADKEVANALDSWTRKTNQLKATIVTLVMDYLDTDRIKKIIDALKNLVDWLDRNKWAIDALIGLLAVVAVSTYGIHLAKQAYEAYQAIEKLVELVGDHLIPALSNISDKVIPALEGSALGVIGEILGGVGAVLAIFAVAHAAQEKANNRRHKAVNEAIQSGDVDAASAAMSNDMQNSVVGRANTWSGRGVSAGLAINEGIRNEGAYSDELKYMLAQTKMSFGTIDNERQLTGYYNRLLELKEQFEKEGIDDDMYQWILGDIKEYEPVVQEYADYLNMMREKNEEAADSFDELAEKTGQPITSLNSLREALAAAAAEIEQYNNEVQRGEKGETLDTYAGIYDTAMEHYANGEFGSAQYQAAMRLLLPDDVLREIGYDYEKAGELASSSWFKAIMAGTEDGGAEFANKLYDMSTVSADGVRGIFDNLGNSIVEITEGEDGSFGLVIDNFEALADIIGVDAQVIEAMADKIDILNSGLNLSKSDVLEMAENAGALTEEVGKFATIDVEKLFNAIVEGGKNAGKSAQEIESDLFHMQDTLMGLDDVNLSVPFAELDGLREKALETASSAGDAEQGLNDLDNANATPEVELDHTVFDAQLAIVNDKLDRLANRTVTVGTRIQAKAEGTDHAEGGLALTGELGPELVQESTGARIVGLDGPEMTVLEEGAKVYTAEETEAILNRKGSARIPTFWKGGTFTRAAAKTAATTTVTRKSGASSSSAKSSAGTKEQTDAQKEQLEIYKAKVTLLETELDLLEAQNKPIKEQVAKAYEIQNALLDQIKYMESIGAEQADINKLYVEWYNWNDKIAKLQKQVFDDLDDAIKNELKDVKDAYDEQTKAIDEQIDALKEARDIKSDELDLEEKQLAVEEARVKLRNAQNERTVRMYNAATGHWESVADPQKVKSAQESLDKAEEALAKYLEDMEYKAQVDALEAQKQAIKDEYSNIEDQWNEILDALKEPAKDLGEVLEEIARNATADQKEDIEILNGMLAKFGYAVPGYGAKYDDGGLLYGVGGIKATATPEGVLSPALTAALLSPQANEVFSQRMAELGYLYGTTQSLPSSMLAGGNRIGSQNNQYGNVYTMNGVTIGEERAKTMSVYELAQLSRNLSAYNRVN